MDAAIGSDAVLAGTDRLEDVTVRSDAAEGAFIGTGVELAHGVVGYGCRVDGGARAYHFVLGTRASLHYGAPGSGKSRGKAAQFEVNSTHRAGQAYSAGARSRARATGPSSGT